MPVITAEPAAGFTKISVDNLSSQDDEKRVLAAVDIRLPDNDLLTFLHIDTGTDTDGLLPFFAFAVDASVDCNVQIEVRKP